MSNLKQNPNLFIGKQELDRLIKFLDEDGFRKLFSENTTAYGLIKNNLDGSFENGHVQLGTNPITVKISEIKAIDNNLNFLYQAAIDNLAISSDGQWYWLQISYQLTPIEVGSFSIDQQGNLVGVNSKLTDILRGMPDHPSVVRFANSQYNLLQYEVTNVIDDSNAVLQGSFTSESNLQLVVVGTFDPTALDPSHKDIFQYDSLQLSINVETVINQAPNFTSGVNFNLARVSFQGGQLIIQDKRTDFWETKGTSFLTKMDSIQNPLFGIESVKFDGLNTPQVYNQVNLSWGFTATNWTINTGANIVTIIGGSGGQFTDSSFFNTGDFDGWRIYTIDGLYSIITSSVKNGSQINLLLDTLDPNRFIDGTQQLIIVPNVEEIEIICKADPTDGTDLPNKIFYFPINRGTTKLFLVCYAELSHYFISYRYKNHWGYGSSHSYKNNSSYLAEASFDEFGTLKPVIGDRVYKNYTATGFIELQLSSTSYSKFVNTIDLNDLSGVYEISNLETEVVANPNRRFDLIPKQTKQNIMVLGSLPLTGSVRMNLVTTNAKNGTSFFIYFKVGLQNSVDVSNFSIDFYSDNTTVLYTLTQDQITKGEQYFKCVFDRDLNKWSIVHYDIDYGNRENLYSKGTELLNTVNDIEVVGTKNVLVISGYYSHIAINNSANRNIDAIRVRNRKHISTLFISATNPSTVNINKATAPISTVDAEYYGFQYDFDTFSLPSNATLQLRLVNLQSIIPTSSVGLSYSVESIDTSLKDVSNVKLFSQNVNNYLNDLIRVCLLSETITSGDIGNGINVVGYNVDTFTRYYELDINSADWVIFPTFQKVGWVEYNQSTNNDNKVADFYYSIGTVGNGHVAIAVVSEAAYAGVGDTIENAPFYLRILCIRRKTFDL